MSEQKPREPLAEKDAEIERLHRALVTVQVALSNNQSTENVIRVIGFIRTELAKGSTSSR